MEKMLVAAMQKRYAVKKFDASKKLSSEQLEKLLEIANLTATSFGIQLMKLVVIEDRTLREQLVKSSYGQKQVADASHLLVLCRERVVDAKHIEEYISTISEVRSVEEGQLDGFKNAMAQSILNMDRNDQVVWMEKQLYILLGNLLTSCALLDIDSCPMEGFVASEYDKILNLESQNLAAVLALPIGYAAKDDFNAKNKKVRRPIDQFIVRFD